ncbi:hypothetical protein L596_002169 [Steinernema carpocapsae]|uniref:Uncharacterized protein n=1 Tax=Steinernema carpocapsae TaxID=34508 RepID=A0A4U8UNS8_STECR|nr:hypothetical protein L596_002169 [Steinernema carpocapsae]
MPPQIDPEGGLYKPAILFLLKKLIGRKHEAALQQLSHLWNQAWLAVRSSSKEEAAPSRWTVFETGIRTLFGDMSIKSLT